MYLVQFLLPLCDNQGHPFERAAFDEVHDEMTEQFGGVTAYLRAPAEGAWQDSAGEVMRDDMIIVEVMCESLDRPFWARYRKELLHRFDQEALIVRAMPFEAL